MEIHKCEGVEYCLYRVQEGDNIAGISAKFNVAPVAIIRNNPAIELYTGEMVKISKKSNTVHIVKPMETLEKIASQYNVDEDTLIRLNSLTNRRLFIGQRLIIDKK